MTCTRRSCTCSGFEHTKFTYRYAGRDFRLTDVHGVVVPELMLRDFKQFAHDRVS